MSFDQDMLSVRLKDGRTITVSLGAPLKLLLLEWVHAIGRLPEAATVSTGQKLTKISALKGCCAEHPLRKISTEKWG